MPGTQQLSPLEVGEDNSNLDLKNSEKYKSVNMVKQRVVIGFLGMLNPNLASIHANPAPSYVFCKFLVQTHDVFCRFFVKPASFKMKLGSQIFQNIRPWL